MSLSNFTILRKHWPELADLGAFAEMHADTQPIAALVQLRRFAEVLVKSLYQRLRLPTPFQPNLYDLMVGDAFRAAVPFVMIGKLHSLRRLGNEAAHGGKVTGLDARTALEAAHDIGRLTLVLFDKVDAATLSSFNPAMIGSARADERCSDPAPVTSPIADLPTTATPTVEAQAEATSALNFDEAATRVELIDRLLSEAGWVGDSLSREFPVGDGGVADYVLWDEHRRPLGVVEAKRTARDAEAGREQAKVYADALEAGHGQRPLIFNTNGYELWMWNDEAGEPPRQLFGFYGQASLETLIARRAEARPLVGQPVSKAIEERTYQQEAVRRVAERFDGKHRRALIVQATGTGKTRVAVTLTELLLKAGRAKRVLFLCDRRELRKQAKDAFAELLPSEPIRIVDGRIGPNPPERIFFATYPAMMGVFRSFDTGYFDLIIADESHRSLYNVYRELLDYFDALRVGLTATPVAAVSRNTFELFGCENGRPTYNYPLEEAVEAKWLVPYEVYEHSTRFSREGLREDILTAEQIKAMEERGEDPASLDYSSDELDRAVFNKDTNRKLLQNLMEHGIRDADGALVGKSIIFARSHDHALLLARLFDEMYPQYGGRVARVIDSQIERAEDLIDQFKTPADPLRIAISVDMLDTGLDVPEVVNLVFARPVRSQVKFWQMVGRGTRLRKDLFGPGQDKTHFRIFDHWDNFERLGQAAPKATPEETTPLLSRLFEARVDLGVAAIERGDQEAKELATALLAADLADLDERSVAVRAKWREKRMAQAPELLGRLAPADVALLTQDVAPLMGWRPLADPVAARFDLQIALLQAARLRGNAAAADLETAVKDAVSRLPMTLAQVQAQAPLIRRLEGAAFWDAATTTELEQARKALRGLMRLADTTGPRVPPRTYDIEEDAADTRLTRRPSGVQAVDMRQYEAEVNAALRGLFESDPALKRIRAGEPVDATDLDRLAKLVLVQNPNISLETLRGFYPETDDLAAFFRRAVGVDPEALRALFAKFSATHPGLSATQTRFLTLLESHIARHGAISVARLYEPPFIAVDAGGLDDLFPDTATADEIIALVERFAPPTPKDSTL